MSLAVRRRDLLFRVAAGSLLLLAAAIFSSALAAPISVPFRLALAALAAASFAAPLTGLLLVCALFPLGSAIGILLGLPWRGTEISESFVQAFLTGWLASLVVRKDSAASPTPLMMAACAFAAVVAASAVVVSHGLQIGGGAVSLFSGRYFDKPQELTPVATAIRLVECILAMVAAHAVPRSTEDRWKAIRMLLAGLTAAASLNVARFIEAVAAREEIVAGARELLQRIRINVQYPDVNAAGSVFAMSVVAAVGLILSTRGTRRLGWIAAWTILVLALWLTGSRTAIASALLAAGGATALGLGQHLTRRSRLILSSTLAVVVVVGAFWMLAWFPRTASNIEPSRAIGMRAELMRRVVRIGADHPWFGIGIGRFFPESLRYASYGASWPENAHNDAGQIFAELGIAGAATFAWVVGAALVLSWRGWASSGACAVWQPAGIAAFLLSGMGGHPLIVFDAAGSFWLLLGLIAAPSPRAPGRTLHVPIAVAAAVLVAVSLPFRWQQATRWFHVDETRIARWQHDGDQPFQNTGRRFVTYVPRKVEHVTLPLRLASAGGEAGQPAIVEVHIDDAAVNRLAVTSQQWTALKVAVPRRDPYRDPRLELVLQAPTGVELLVGRITLRERQ